MTPEEQIKEVVMRLREAANKIERRENISLILATMIPIPGEHGGGVYLFAPPDAAAELTMRIFAATQMLWRCTLRQEHSIGSTKDEQKTKDD